MVSSHWIFYTCLFCSMFSCWTLVELFCHWFDQERLVESDTEIPDAAVAVLPKDSIVRKCLQGRTSTQEKMIAAGDYFYPLEMEFCLSSVASLWSLRNEQGILKNTYTDYLNLQREVLSWQSDPAVTKLFSVFWLSGEDGLCPATVKGNASKSKIFFIEMQFLFISCLLLSC